MVGCHHSEENYSLTDITIVNETQAYSTVYDQTGTFNQLLINCVNSIASKRSKKTKRKSTDENTTVTDRSPFNWDQSTNSSKQDRYQPPTIEIYIRRQPPPIHVETVNYQPKSKEIHIQYDQINVKIEREIRQRNTIKCVDPYEYVRQYGRTLYSPESFQKIFQEIIS